MTNSDSDKDLDVDKRCEAPLQLLFQHALLNGLHLIQTLHLIQLRQDGYHIGERDGEREGEREREREGGREKAITTTDKILVVPKSNATI